MGTTISDEPFLAVSPQEVDFGALVIGSVAQGSGLSNAMIVSNLGNQVLTFTGFAWDDATNSNVYFNLTAGGNGSKIVGNGFMSSDFPAVGDTIPVGGSVTIPLSFKTNARRKTGGC